MKNGYNIYFILFAFIISIPLLSQTSGNATYISKYFDTNIKNFKAKGEIKITFTSESYSYQFFNPNIPTINFQEFKTNHYNNTGIVIDTNSRVYLEQKNKINEYFKNPPMNFIDIIDKKSYRINPQNDIHLEEYLIYTNLPNYEFELVDDTITINNIKCQKALYKMNNSEYNVWFAPSIPTIAGPVFYRGLPGLILKVESKDKSYIIELSDLNYPSTDTLKIIHKENFKNIFSSDEFNIKIKNGELINLDKIKQQLLNKRE